MCVNVLGSSIRRQARERAGIMGDIGPNVKSVSDRLWKFRLENQGELPRQKSDLDERRLANAVAKLQIRCYKSLGSQPSHALLTSAENLYFTRRLKGALLDGLWREAVIEGTHLQFHDGVPSPSIDITSPTTLTMTMSSDYPDEGFAGFSYRAELRPDDQLHWEDGCVWERCVGCIDEDGNVDFQCPGTPQTGTLADGSEYAASIHRVVPATEFHLRAVGARAAPPNSASATSVSR